MLNGVLDSANGSVVCSASFVWFLVLVDGTLRLSLANLNVRQERSIVIWLLCRWLAFHGFLTRRARRTEFALASNSQPWIRQQALSPANVPTPSP